MEKKSLKDFDLVSACNQTFEFEYIEPDGKASGLFLEIIGAHSEKVQKWRNNKLNQQRQADAMNKKRGRDDLVRTIEADIDFGLEFISIRIVGWKGISDPCTPENAALLCHINPELTQQVAQHSENLANFTKSK
jgi:hypothetical protein